MFSKLIDSKKFSGANCVIWKNGHVIYNESNGYKNLEPVEYLTGDTIFRIASMTKPITSVLAMMLVEEQKFKLTDPIAKWFPEFDNMKVLTNRPGVYEVAKQPITVLDLLTHRAGFTYAEFQHGKLKEDYTNILGADIDSTLTTKQWLAGLASLPLVSEPGELFNYGKSTDLLGILLATIEGKPLSKVMQEKIFKPLGMTDTFFVVPSEKKNRCAANIGYDEWGTITKLENVPLNMALNERPEGLEFESGGGGLWSTTNDYLQFAKLFTEQGRSNGVQLLQPKTIALMCTNQLTDAQRAKSTLMGTHIFKEHYGFGLGLAVVCKENTYGSIPCSGAIGSVGWPGAYGGWWSADPSRKTVSIFLTHSMTEPSQLAQGIGFELYGAIDLFSKYSNEIFQPTG